MTQPMPLVEAAVRLALDELDSGEWANREREHGHAFGRGLAYATELIRERIAEAEAAQRALDGTEVPVAHESVTEAFSRLAIMRRAMADEYCEHCHRPLPHNAHEAAVCAASQWPEPPGDA